MPDFLWPALRGLHVLALFALFGAAVSHLLFAPDALKARLRTRLWRSSLYAALLNAVVAPLIYITQAGLMGDGPADMLNPDILTALLGTRFGSVWVFQIVLAIATLCAMLLSARSAWPLTLILCAAQLILLAGVGHAAMREGVPGTLSRINYALHILCAAWWVGGLLPLLVCLSLGRDTRFRQPAIIAMQRFSLSGHAAVAGVLLTGSLNTILLLDFSWHGATAWVQMLLLKCALVVLMVAIALWNRYVLVPRFSTEGERAFGQFIRLTQLEMLLGIAAVAIVSLFANWAPF